MAELLSSERFGENAREALGDEGLRTALRNATDLFAERRQAAIASRPDWEELREEARAIKAETLARLDHYLEEFTKNAEAAGVHVHWAVDAKEANATILAIAQAAGARTVVKSKSMTTEEIHLNKALEDAGLVPVETDLGEWIIQLADEVPSHIIVPAIHKSKEDIADLFADKLALERTTDPAELTHAARRILRETFAEADLGVSGVNFGIAETGSFLVLENEGNARMCTSLPRVHIGVMGIEKLLPKLQDLEVFLRLLPRSGTGQHLTSYQTLFTGPRRAGGEGPEELHLVLLDNGRSNMLEREVTRQSLACIRCGACLNACPVYQQIGGHAYGSVYPGPIGAVITPQLSGYETTHELPYASSLCGACRDVCPVKIDIPALLLHLRGRIASGQSMPLGSDHGRPIDKRERRAFRMWAWAAKSPRRYRWFARLVRFTAPLHDTVFVRAFFPPIFAWTKNRTLPRVAPRSFRDTWKEQDG